MRPRPGAIALALAAALSGCGLQVRSPDLFLLTRTGPSGTLTLLVNDGGTIRCNGGKPKNLPDSVLIQARDLSDNLAGDAQRHLRLPATSASVYSYTIRMQQGTIRFPDTAAQTHRALAQAELFALQTAAGVCGLTS